jgi:type II secretion system protein J
MKSQKIKKAAGSLQGGEERGFTLIELLVAVSILAVLVAAIYATLFNVLGTRESVEAQMDRLREFRRFTARLEKEVRASYVSPSDEHSLWQGSGAQSSSSPSASFSLTYYAFPLSRGPSGDLMAVSYSAEDTDNGITLFRETWNPYTGSRSGRAEVMEGIEGFEAAFYDGEKWEDTWDGAARKGPPQAVRVSILIKALEGINRLTTTVVTMIR